MMRFTLIAAIVALARATIHRPSFGPVQWIQTGTFELHRRPPAEGEPTTIMDVVRKMMQERGVRGA